MTKYFTPEEKSLAKIHRNMVGRCTDPRTNGYKYYGGKGISIYPDWEDVTEFIKWSLSAGYESGLSIDRKDSDLPYFPDNCQWISKKENNSSRKEQPHIPVDIEIEEQFCKRCGHKWIPRIKKVKICPKCKSIYWQTQKRNSKPSVL